MKLLNRYDEQIRKDALSMTERAFCNTYRHYDTEENLKRIQKDIQNEPSKAMREHIAEYTDEATDLPDLPPIDQQHERESIKEIITQTDEAQYESFEVQAAKIAEARVIPRNDKTTAEIIAGAKTRAERMKELIAEGIEKAEVKRIMEEEGYEFKGSVFHSEYRRLTK